MMKVKWNENKERENYKYKSQRKVIRHLHNLSFCGRQPNKGKNP